jgi:hypothetical protein
VFESVVIVAFSNLPFVLLYFKNWLSEGVDTFTSDKSLNAAAEAEPPKLVAAKLLKTPLVNILACAVLFKATLLPPFTITAPK